MGAPASGDVVIVGAGHAGAQAAIALRQGGHAGGIVVIGDEPDLPYERPPLSKDYLSGNKPYERLLIRPANFWAERNVEMRLGRRVVAVDPEARTVRDDQGGTHAYAHLIWAAGGAPRQLGDGHHLTGVHTVRTRADADRMRDELPGTSCAVVIGGGYIGLEAAAVLAKAGKRVTVLEAQDRVLARVAGEPLSRFYEAEHRAHGVDVRLNACVDSFEERDGRVTGVRLAGGEVLPCEMVIVGIGIAPAVEPLLAAGAQGAPGGGAPGGVLVDAQCRTTLPNVFAVGDCALHANPFAPGAPIRLESVQNAVDQATVAARTIAGAHAEYVAVPWFWSDQYDLKLQTVGLSTGHDEAILRGDPAARSFSLVYRRAGRVIALDCVNAARDYVQGKKLVTSGSTADPALLADPDVPLKTL